MNVPLLFVTPKAPLVAIFTLKFVTLFMQTARNYDQQYRNFQSFALPVELIMDKGAALDDGFSLRSLKLCEYGPPVNILFHNSWHKPKKGSVQTCS